MKYQFFTTLPIVLALCFASCATLPKESIELSADLHHQISMLKTANAALIDSVYSAKERDVTNYLDNDWYPVYVRNLFETETVSAMWNMALESDDAETRMEVMKLITKQVIDNYRAEKDMMMKPVEEERKEVRNAFGAEFDKASEMNAALGRLLSSHYDVQSSYIRMLPEGKAEQLDSVLRVSVLKLDKHLQQSKENSETIKNAIETVKDNH